MGVLLVGKGLVTRNTNVKYESRTCYSSNVMTKFKVFSKCRSKVIVKVTKSNSLVLMERYCQKEYTCEI